MAKLPRCTSKSYTCGKICLGALKTCRIGNAETTKAQIAALDGLADLLERGEKDTRKGIGLERSPEKIRQKSAQLKAAIEAAEREAARLQEEAEKKAEAERLAKEQEIARRDQTDPRAIAEEVTGEGDYKFARNSAIPNAGEDLAGSARHRRNAFKNFEEVNGTGQVDSLMTKNNMIKNFPVDFISGLDASNAGNRLLAYYALESFPAAPVKDFAVYTSSMKAGRGYYKTDAETLRRQYFDAFIKIRGKIDELKDSENASMMLLELSKTTSELISSYRAGGDSFNPTANALVSLSNRLRAGSKTSAVNRTRDALKLINASAKGSDPSEREKNLVDMVASVIQGSSVNAAVGQKKEGKKVFKPADLYTLSTATRKGGRKIGGDAKKATDAIMNSFNFRGLQYGNSVTDDERAHHVQKIAESFVDLADVTGFPDSAIGLEGTLGIAVGARGKGGAMAHFEPDLKVINLTRKKGVGTLAHEWGHALDNYLAKGTGFSSERPGTLDAEVRQAMRDLKIGWQSTGYEAQVREAIKDMKEQGLAVNEDYWLRGTEMLARTFESYVQHKLRVNGRENTYLSAPTGSPLWPTDEQAAKMAPLFDDLMSAINKNLFSSSRAKRDSREARIAWFKAQIAGDRHSLKCR